MNNNNNRKILMNKMKRIRSTTKKINNKKWMINNRIIKKIQIKIYFKWDNSVNKFINPQKIMHNRLEIKHKI
jgi:hypothetical protein